MTSSKRDQLLARAFHAIMGKTEADILQIARNWNWKCIFIHQRYFFRKIPAINVSFASKYVHFQGWSRKFGAKYEDIPNKILKRHTRIKSS